MAGQSTFSIFARMVLQDDEYRNKLNKQARELRSELNRQAKHWNDYGKVFTDVGAKMTAVFGGIVIAATTSFVKFEDKIANINTLLDDTTNLEGYKNAILNLGNEFGISSDIMADGMYQTISSIGDMGQETEKMFAIMAKSAKAGGAEVGDSVALISAGMKGYGQVNEETAKKISDLAFQTAKLGVTTFPEMATSMKPLFPLASTLNISLEELFGSMATLTGVTGNTAEVSTQLKAVMSNLIKPTGEMQKLMKKYGFESGDAMLKSKGLAGTLDILKKETGGSSKEMGKLFSSTEALTALLALTGEQYDVFIDKTSAMTNATGATDTAFGKLENTLKFKIDKSIVNIKNSFIKLGEKMLPTVEKMLGGVEKFADKIANLDEETIGNIATFVQWGLGLGVAFLAIGKVCTAVGTFKLALASSNKFLMGATTETGKTTGGLINLVKKGFNPTTLAIVGGVGLIAALVKFGIECNKTTDGINAVEEKTKSMKKEVVNAAGEINTIQLDFSEEYKVELEKVTKYWEDNLLKISEYPTELTEGSKELIKGNLEELKKYDEEYNKVVKENREIAMKDFEKDNEGLKAISNELYEAKKKDFEKTYDAAIESENKLIDDINAIHENAEKRGYYTQEDVTELERLTEEMVTTAGSGLTKHLEDIMAFEQKKEEMYGQLTEKGKMIAEKKWNDISDAYIAEKQLQDTAYLEAKTRLENGEIDYAVYNEAIDNIAAGRIETTTKLETDQSEWLAHMKATYKNDEDAMKWLDGVEKTMQGARKSRQADTVATLQNLGFTKAQICQQMGIDEKTYTSLDNGNKASQNLSMEQQQAKMAELKNKKDWLTKELKRLGIEEVGDVKKFSQAQVDDLSKLITQFNTGKINAEQLKTGISNLQSKSIDVVTNYKTTGSPAKNAKGTEYFGGGLTWVGERGAELIHLPKGAKVKNARASKHIENTSEAKEIPVVSVQIDGKEIVRAVGKYLDDELGHQKNKKRW